MAANEFVAKLKADGTDKDVYNIDKLYEEYKEITAKLSSKDRGTFSLNVLCILCRNLDKVPTWRTKVDCKGLLTLSIDCVRETRGLEKDDKVKTLACIYNIHRYISRSNPSPPPELVLKLSFMPFEAETLLKDYYKTYWNILADRLNYIEKLKKKLSIAKLLPKLTNDIIRIIKIYDTIQFCATIIVFLMKKLHFLFSELNSTQLNQVFKAIFEALTKNDDVKSFKKLSDKETNDLYVKFNDCLYVIAENASRSDFKDSALDSGVRACLTLLGHCSDVFHCLQTFYLHTFCYLLSNKPDITYMETIINNLEVSCEMSEKLGYYKRMYLTYPYLNQLFRLYIEHASKININELTEVIHEKSLKFILFLICKLKNCEQLLKCENCEVKTGLHDCLRISFLIKNFVNEKFTYKCVLPTFYAILKQQYNILSELKASGCVNCDKYYRKIQTDVHNTAIILNKTENYEFSIKFFNIYLKFEMNNSNTEFKNISRALYNKGICQLDFKMYEKALLDAYLSLIFAQNEGLTDKHMCLVMDIKAKSLKASEEKCVENDHLQLISMYEACKILMESNYYGNLKPFLFNLKFSTLLQHEYSLYAKLWPSIVPIAGIWKSLHELTKQNNLEWLKGENKDTLLTTLYSVMLNTPSVVRTMDCGYFKDIVTEALKDLEKSHTNDPDLKLIYVTLLFLKADYDMTEASEKYGWKVAENTLDPDGVSACRTLPQEHAATRTTLQAVRAWVELGDELQSIKSSSNLLCGLSVAQPPVAQLLALHRVSSALQLARACARAAAVAGDRESYVRNVGVILSHMTEPSEGLNTLLKLAGEYWIQLVKDPSSLETAVCFVCDAAIFYSRCGCVAKSAKLVQTAQAHIINAYDKYPDVNLDLAVGRLLEAQTVLCGDCGPSTLSAVNNTQRHYLALTNNATKHTSRRLRGLSVKHRASGAALRAAGLGRALARGPRGRRGPGAAAGAAPARGLLLALLVDTYKADDAQVKLDKIKHILGLQPTSEPQTPAQKVKQAVFTPKQDIETMLENVTFKKCQVSPSLPCTAVPAFKIPEFLKHPEKCTCYACELPIVSIICATVCGMEASVFYRGGEFEIAKNYFAGSLLCFELINKKLKSAIAVYRKEIDGFLVDAVERDYFNEFGRVKLEVLMEAAFFELANKNYMTADEYIVMIHEMMQDLETLSPYLRNELMNLMTVSAQMRRIVKRPDVEGLDVEFDNLKLDPNTQPKTPESKPLVVKESTKIIVNADELPNVKRKVIKLNLDEASSDESEVKQKGGKKTVFKVPDLKTSKPMMENATPVIKLRRKVELTKTPKVLVTQPSEEIATPRNDKEFFTPSASPEQFFTPMTSIKTYKKVGLRQNIVKNLECEFSTPNAKENQPLNSNIHLEVPQRSRGRKKIETLKRATSPGKLVKEVRSNTRSRRLRNPVNFSLDDEKK